MTGPRRHSRGFLHVIATNRVKRFVVRGGVAYQASDGGPIATQVAPWLTYRAVSHSRPRIGVAISEMIDGALSSAVLRCCPSPRPQIARRRLSQLLECAPM